MSSPTMPDWTFLPADIILMLTEKLTSSVDYVRFRSVCPWWRSVVPRVKFPPLILHTFDSSEDNLISLFDVTYKNLYYLHLPEIKGKELVGTSNGWLILMKQDLNSFSLLNPFAREEYIQLPPILKKSELWCPPSHVALSFSSSMRSGNRCLTLAIVLQCPNRFAFLKLGDKRWTILEFNQREYVISFVSCGKNFYALTRSGALLVCKAGPPASAMRVDYLLRLPYEPSCNISIMDIEGSLVMINDDNECGIQPHRYYIYKLSSISPRGRKVWRQLDKLEGISLFLNKRGIGRSAICTKLTQGIYTFDNFDDFDDFDGNWGEVLFKIRIQVGQSVESETCRVPSETYYHYNFFEAYPYWFIPNLVSRSLIRTSNLN